MKKLFIASAIALCMAFSACSNDEPEPPEGGDQESPEGGNTESPDEVQPDSPDILVGEFKYTGSTDSSAEGMPSFVKDETGFIATIADDARTVTIVIDGAQFIGMMPALVISFDNIPITEIDSEGVYHFESPDFLPTIGGVPYEKYRITDLSGKLTPNVDFSMEFVCNVQNNSFTMPFKVLASGTAVK